VATLPPAPREREIEILARLARGVLIILRVLAVLVGLAAIGAAVFATLRPETVMSENEPVPPLAQRIANNMAFVCFGLPLLLPVRWFSRTRLVPLLLAGAAAWFGPSFLPGDQAWGCVLRAFASSVGVVALFLWRTLFGLTQPASGAPG
jgi:hypothetical protein